VFFSHRKFKWAIGSIFFDSIRTRKNLTQYIEQHYIPGAEDNDFVQIINHMQQVDKKTLLKGLYKCSCDFPYLIGNCTRPWVKHKCPKCGLDIGGERHVLIKRKGHMRITDYEKFFSEIRERYNQKGYVVKVFNELSLFHKIRGTTPLCYRIIHLFIHSMMFIFL
jgi:hypothetical protein